MSGCPSDCAGGAVGGESKFHQSAVKREKELLDELGKLQKDAQRMCALLVRAHSIAETRGLNEKSTSDAIESVKRMGRMISARLRVCATSVDEHVEAGEGHLLEHLAKAGEEGIV